MKTQRHKVEEGKLTSVRAEELRGGGLPVWVLSLGGLDDPDSVDHLHHSPGDPMCHLVVHKEKSELIH